MAELPGETDKEVARAPPKDQTDISNLGSGLLAVAEPEEENEAVVNRPASVPISSLSTMIVHPEDVPQSRQTSPPTEPTEGEPQRDVSSLQVLLSTSKTSTKDGDDCETIAPLSPRRSAYTINAPKPNPSIMLEDRPLPLSREGTPPPTGPKAIKFKSSNIIVPDYRWSKDEGMVASPSAALLDFPDVSRDMKKLGSTSPTPPSWSSGKVKTNFHSWSDQISPRTIVNPVQYADAPPIENWRKIQPIQKDSLNPTDNTGTSPAGTNSALDESPLLPITAYSFSTDSSPPETPASQQQEVVTPENDHVELPSVHVFPDSVPQMSAEDRGVNTRHYGQEVANFNQSSTANQETMFGIRVYPWVVDTYLQQVKSVPTHDLWVNPLASDYGTPTATPMSKCAFAKKLARQARLGELPPQVPQDKTNYRSTSIRTSLSFLPS
ncbi:hypothetical protein QFC19_007417 [Naganishia cerealis]|uniref:Uncharacterized protein n=1 Tax=Naganishia cerealis TaxID=610337 RepID=A0ACC2V9K9_9TREE|nr:hypothetical protein QFC19_007417 [Naganishia cerealis]